MGETVTQKTEPWSGQQSYLKDIYRQAQGNYNNRSTYFPGQTWLPLNDVQQQAMQDQMAYATGDPMRQMIGGSQASLQSMFNAPDVANNQYIGGVADVLTDRLNRNMNENILPAVQGNFNMAGQYGGARQDAFRQQAGRDTQEALSQGLAGLYADAYDTGMSQQARGLQLAPTTAQMGFIPSQTQASIGDIMQQESYKPLEEDIARWNYEQQAPWTDLQRYVSSVGGNVGSQMTSNSEQSSNVLGNIIGGGMLGYGINSGFSGSPFSNAGAGLLGGVLGGLGSLF